jgi:hypothetical protein
MQFIPFAACPELHAETDRNFSTRALRLLRGNSYRMEQITKSEQTGLGQMIQPPQITEFTESENELLFSPCSAVTCGG